MEYSISIIMPAYNAQKTLEKSVQSLMNQTFSDWEVIIVNDGSRDNTLSVAKLLSKKDGRIRVLSQENSGALMARHIGVMNSKGKYITFLDADDELKPFALQTMFDAMKEDVDIAAFQSNKKIEMTAEEYANKILRRQSNWNVWGKFYRRELFNEDTFAVRNLNLADDFIGNLNILRNVQKKIVFFPQSVYIYNENPLSLTSTHRRKLEDEMRVISLVKEAVSKLPFDANEGLWCYEIGMLGGFIAHGLPIDLNNEWVKSVESRAKLYSSQKWHTSVLKSIHSPWLRLLSRTNKRLRIIAKRVIFGIKGSR